MESLTFAETEIVPKRYSKMHVRAAVISEELANPLGTL
jgi:hypothetical protein